MMFLILLTADNIRDSLQKLSRNSIKSLRIILYPPLPRNAAMWSLESCSDAAKLSRRAS